MKKAFTRFLVIIWLCVQGCGSKELSREKAEELIIEKMRYPRPLDFKVPVISINSAAKAYQGNLEKEGWVRLVKVQTIHNVRDQKIFFTEKAKPYLLPQSEEDSVKSFQPIRLADEEFVEVTGIKQRNTAKSVLVKYTTTLKNFTPFMVMLPEKLKAHTVQNWAIITLYDDGWRVESTSDESY